MADTKLSAAPAAPVAAPTAATQAGEYSIHVSGLGPDTTEMKLHDFFSFCGKLVSVNKTGKTAIVTFEKASAMRTALMLNGGTLDGAHLEVTSTSDTEPKTPPTQAAAVPPAGAHDIAQEDKPKAAIAAEYLAHGYFLGDHVIQRAIDFDHKQGISTRFLNFLNSMDAKAGQRFVGEDKTVSGKFNESAAAMLAKTREVDQNRGVTKTFTDYYHNFIGTPVGQRMHQFYSDTQKQVMDVHEEARRIADQKKAAVRAAGGGAEAHDDEAEKTDSIPPSAGAPAAGSTTAAKPQ